MDAIPIIKRPFIMRVLRSQGNYDQHHQGRHVRIFRSERTGQICFRVGRGPRTVGGQADTPGEAIDQVNQIIAGNFQPRKYQLPYKDDL